ncbi:DUF2946 domain-containing protein [Pseudomonas sp. LP_7_YM]|uniref:DUF2946 domain-containing protein n=1 Tax=Pseudomonas sp. LP_7_YM TaxID=2485137 RepID=UPI0010E535D8|nr:DUF2946 domain-containing protein [Pseudomonas sp. LP_7_YM]TDV65885.1 DUF2946 family protein [Pseudomonas sp. LP_7_YM]
MNQQQKKIISLERRRAFAWVACFALLFGMLMMPMTPTMPRTQGDQLVGGSLCSGGGTRLVAITIAPVDQRNPDRNDPVLMQHCRCCSGALSMVAVPAGNQPGFIMLVQPLRLPNAVLVIHAPARVLWPNLNPRASPRV